VKILKPISKKAVPERRYNAGSERASMYAACLSQVGSLKDSQALPVDFNTLSIAKSAYAIMAAKIKAENLSIVISRRGKIIYLAKAEVEMAEVVSTSRRARW
jgi:hypothetical protein